MMSKRILLMLLGVIGLGLTPCLGQTVPETMNYQGRLTDGGGNAITGQRDLEINIYSASSGGTLLWGPQKFSTQDISANGEFNIILGPNDTATPSPRALSTAFAGANAFLEIKVGPVGGALQAISPRQQILSAPYALYAQQVPLPYTKQLVNTSFTGSVGSSVHQQIPGLRAQSFPVRKGSSIRVRLIVQIELPPATSIANNGWAIYVNGTQVGAMRQYVSSDDIGFVMLEELIGPSSLGNASAATTVDIAGYCNYANEVINLISGTSTMAIEEVFPSQLAP